MRFLWTQALWLLLALPGVVAAYVVAWRRRRPALPYSNTRLIREAMGTRSRLRPHIPAALLLGTLVLSLLALARPVALVTTPSHERTIVLAIDVSLSMGAEDMEPSRLGAAQSAAKAFIRSLPADVRIGVVAFASHAYLVQRPTVDHLKVSEAIDRLDLHYRSAIGSGLLGALMTIFPDEPIAEDYDIFGNEVHRAAGDPLRLDRDRANDATLDAAAPAPGAHPSAAIVLLTDGADNGGMPADRAAQYAVERGVRVYTVGFGRPGTMHVHNDGTTEAGFDEDVLKRIAASTRGTYFPAATAQQLSVVYRNLPGRIVLKKLGTELAAFFAAAAAFLAIAAGGLSLAWNGPFASGRGSPAG